MLQSDTQAARERVLERIGRFVQTYRIALWVVLGALLVSIVTYFVWSERDKKLREDSTILAEEAQDTFDRWLTEEDEETKEDLESRLVDRLDAIVNRYSRQYGAQRGLYLRAALAYEKGELDRASEDYRELVDRFPESYLAALSLYNAAVCEESLEDMQEARSLYARIVGDYGESHLVPHALFSMGRISESLEEYEAAREAYVQLEENHPLSLWTQVATNRRLALKVSGEVTE